MPVKAIQLVENLKARAICETTPRYDVIFRGQKVNQLCFNTRGYIGYLPCPPDNGSDKLFGFVDIGEKGIGAFKKEVARLNREWDNYRPSVIPVLPNQPEYFIAVQCRTTDTGLTGTFIYRRNPEKKRIAISPIFDGLYQLYPWMKQNGWVAAEYDAQGNNFTPWRVAQLQPASV